MCYCSFSDSSGYYGALMTGDVAMYFWGNNGVHPHFLAQLFIAVLLAHAGFYGVTFLLKVLRIDNRQ